MLSKANKGGISFKIFSNPITMVSFSNVIMQSYLIGYYLSDNRLNIGVTNCFPNILKSLPQDSANRPTKLIIGRIMVFVLSLNN